MDVHSTKDLVDIMDVVQGEEMRVQQLTAEQLELPFEEFIPRCFLCGIKATSTTRRLSVLRALTLKLGSEELPNEFLPVVIQYLLFTIPRYTDKTSHRAVLDALKVVYETDTAKYDNVIESPSLSITIKLMEKELKGNISSWSPSLIYNYVCWTNLLIRYCLSSKIPPTQLSNVGGWSLWETLIRFHCTLLSALALSEQHRKEILYLRAIHTTCETLYRVEQGGIDLILKTLLSLPYDDINKSALLGILMEALISRNQLENAATYRDQLIEFFTRTVMASRTAVPSTYLRGFGILFKHSITLDLFQKDIVPSAERLLLRSPEVVINVLDHTIKYLPFDLSKCFREKFAEPLLNSMKSTNATVRSDAASLFETLCVKSSNEAEVVKIVDIVIKALTTKGPSAEQRHSFYTALSRLPPLRTVSQRILEHAPTLTNKESNDTALQNFVRSLSPHVQAYLTAAQAPDRKVISGFVEFLLAGLNDVKSGTRRAYLSLTTAALTAPQLEALGGGLEKLVDRVEKVVENVQKAGIALLDPKKETPALVEAYLGVRWLQEVQLGQFENNGPVYVKSDFFRHTLSPQAQKSFFFNDKLYTKLLPTLDDQIPFIRAVTAILENDEWYNYAGGSGSVESKMPLALALIWALVQSTYHEVRREAHTALSRMIALRRPVLLERLVDVVRIGACSILPDADPAIETLHWKNKPSRSSDALGYRIFAALCAVLPRSGDRSDPDDWQSSTESALMDISVLACHPIVTELMGDDVWVRLCFRAGTGPYVVDRHGPTYMKAWLSSRNIEDVSKGGVGENIPAAMRCATLRTLTLFTEVAAETIVNAAVPFTLQALENEEVLHLTPVDIEIWHTPEGTLCFDPTSKKGSGKRMEAQPKTAEEKWERDLRKELEAKRGKGVATTTGDAKLSKADRELRQQQLDKEKQIRQKVETIRCKMITGMDVLNAVIDGVQRSVGKEASLAFGRWMSKIVRVLLYGMISKEMVVLKRESTDTHPLPLAGTAAIRTYVKLGEGFEDILHTIAHPPVLAMATLRALGVVEGEGGVDETFCKKSLPEFLADVLIHMQKLYTGSEPLNTVVFSYMFPLLQAIILREGRVGTLKERAVTDLCMSASDILLAHCALASSEIVPRREMVRCLLQLLEQYPRLRGAGREGLSTVAFAISAGEGDDDEEAESYTSNGNSKNARESDLEGVIQELLEGLLSPEEAVRESALIALSHLPVPANLADIFDARVWMASYDEAEEIKQQADTLWREWNGTESIDLEGIAKILALAVHTVEPVRKNAGRALSSALKIHRSRVSHTLDELYKVYFEKAAIPEPEYDDYGMVIPESLNKPDEWEARAGVAFALRSCAPVLTQLEPLEQLMSFLIEGEALGDRNEKVQRLMLDAGLAAVNANGKTYVRALLDIVSHYLSKPPKASEAHDRIRESCVILLGTLAQHLETTDPMIPEVIAKLIETLKTPSETVQMAVSECLPALIKGTKHDVHKLVEQLLHQLYTSPKYGERRGAAYGLAGVVKGCGVSALKEYHIMSSLKEAVEDKKRPERREGALFAFETLSQTLGRLFEPYVIQILPLLLVCFGDSNRDVREATEDACRVIMSKLSAHCVKLVLPSLLNGLEDRNWRTKTGSIDVLSSMAFLAPKQLSMSLPTVVPRLCDVLADSHAKVQQSAKQALGQFGNVIKNPEIQELVPTLLSALVDPNGKTGAALSALLDTAFVHYIDAPSLALVVPILQRGLKERGTDIKKKAAQIMGNMASLTDPKDLVPYLPALMPGLREVLVDPVPEARAIAAKAFGNMVAKLGEDNFPGLVGELVDTLKSDTSGVDRNGAAQGLSEVISGLGLQKLEGLLPEILANAESTKPYVREGFMTLLIYLPATHGEKFQPYLGTIIPSVLRGLADESEPVRDASLKTGQMIVRNYATSAVDLLLPELERGLFDENWRIRQSSVQLMGDLLYRIAGVSGKVELEAPEDETLGTEHGKQALLHALGKERYDKVLASLYVARADASAIVRQASLHVWKSIVSNTPRTLKEILPNMMEILVSSLASESPDKQGSAARCLGDLVRKLGESILHEILPILEKGLDSYDDGVRQGVCVAMTEIMASAGKTQVVEFVTRCVDLVKKALVDVEPGVREAAAQAFDMLHQHIGKQAIDEILPSLLNILKAGDAQATDSSLHALEALKEIMAVRSNVVFPVLIPTLISRPISSFNAHALASLITVAGPALNKRLGAILPPLMDAMEDGDDAMEDVRTTVNVLVVNVEGEDGVHQLMTLLMDAVKNGLPVRKLAGLECLKMFCEGNKEPLDSEYIADWINILVAMLRGGQNGNDVVKSAWLALEAIVKRIKKEEMERFVPIVRRAIRDAEDSINPDEVFEGLSLPKGISPILPIFLQGLMYGSVEIREQSALGLGDIVRRASPESLKPFVTQITGPLIRVIGDRFPSGVKCAILMTLWQLLERVSPMLKPFLPQLQRTFVKCLSEPGSGMVRDRAARCLSALIGLQTRLDPLVVELAQGIRGAEDRGVREAMWEAMYGVVKGVASPGKALNETSQKTIETLVTDAISGSGEHDDGIRAGAAKVFGAYCSYVPMESSKSLISSQVLGALKTDVWYRLAGAMVCLNWTFLEAPNLIHDLELTTEIIPLLEEGLSNEKPQVVEEAVRATGHMLGIQTYIGEGVADKLIPILVADVLPAGKTSNDARREAEVVIKNLAKDSHRDVAAHLPTIVPALMLCVRDRNIPVKLAAERALVHIFEIGKGTDVLQSYMHTLDAATARSIGDYARRVLSKLVDKGSDDESNT